MANINDFKAKLAGGGARANQFKVTMPFPGYAQVGGEIEDLAFLCTTAQIPAMNVGLVNVPEEYESRSSKNYRANCGDHIQRGKSIASQVVRISTRHTLNAQPVLN